ncbi:MAG: M24 family metallopeptidase, partial [Pseudomonadota bacterium]
AAITNSMLLAGGDAPAAEVAVNSGHDALLVRGRSGDRDIGTNDQVSLSFAASRARYHAAIKDTVVLGEARPQHGDMFDAAEAALAASVAAMRPGNTFGDVSNANAQVIRDRGMGKLRLNACGTSMGASFAPSWNNDPMFYQGNPTEIVPNMTLFAHAVLLDSEHDAAMGIGRTYLTTDGEAECLSGVPIRFIRK